jgi:hypothetical protein
MAAVALMPALFGCAAGREPSNPHEALRAYALALKEQRTADAYALLSREAKTHLSFAEFSRMLSENPREIEDISAGLLQPAEAPEITATLSSPDGETLRLVYEGDAWRVDGSTLDLYSQATPQSAIESFLRAYANQRYDILLRFVPDAKREGLTEVKLREAWQGEQREQLEKLTQALSASLPNLRIETLGTRATVAYGAGGTLELVHEQGEWRIEDF